MIEINAETKDPEIIQEEVTNLDTRTQKAFDDMDLHKKNTVAARKNLKGMKTYIALIIVLLLYFILKVISSP